MKQKLLDRAVVSCLCSTNHLCLRFWFMWRGRNMDSRTYTPLQKIVSKAHHHELLGKCLQGNPGAKPAGRGCWPAALASVKPLSEMQAEVSAWHWDPSALQLSGENHSSSHPCSLGLFNMMDQGRMKYTRLINVSLISNRTNMFGLWVFYTEDTGMTYQVVLYPFCSVLFPCKNINLVHKIKNKNRFFSTK